MSRSFLTQVSVENYKSIEKCSVEARQLTILVGRNGAGKSNLLDALRFVADSLRDGMENAIKARGGLNEVRRRSTGHPRNFAVKLEMALPDAYAEHYRARAAERGEGGAADHQMPLHGLIDTRPPEARLARAEQAAPILATYGFLVAARSAGGYVIKREELRVRTESGLALCHYAVEGGAVVDSSETSVPPASPTRLFLVNAAGLPIYRGAYDALSTMGFYNLNPDSIKDLQSPDAGDLLHRDGANIASVVARISDDRPDLWQRIRQVLATIVPGFADVCRVAVGPKETLEFRQEMNGTKPPFRFYAANMSDGTLRALGILIAVMQLADRREAISLVGIEEPETALHPAAAGALMAALREATAHTQIVVTTHSPDLLEHIDLENDQLLGVSAQGGSTSIAPLDKKSVESIKRHLLTAGELQRLDQLGLDEEDVKRQLRLKLFDEEEAAA
jgi:predicted ATPase